MEQNNNNTESTSVEGNWPGAWGVYKYSRNAIRKSLSTYLLVVLGSYGIFYIIGLIAQLIFGKYYGLAVYYLVALAVVFCVTIALMKIYISGVRGKRVELEEATKYIPSFWLRMCLLQLLVWVTVIGGYLLLIVPGIIFQLRLSLATYYLVDKNMSVMEAYKASWEATKGNLGKIWGLVGVKVIFAILCIIIIGIYFNIMYSTAFAELYEYLEKNKSTSTTNPKS